MNCTGKRCLAQYNKVDPATCTAVPYCPQATPPKTNADRIRSMTDEELALWKRTECPGSQKPCLKVPYRVDCTSCWLEWLKEEVEHDR